MATQPSTRGAPTRKFIYLIMDGGNDTHTLHRIDTSPLFARGGRARHGPEAKKRRFAAGGRERHGTEAAQPAAGASATLPQPLARFDCAAGRQFLALGNGVDKIVSVDRNRHTVIFDTRTESVRAGPDASYVKWHAWGSPWAEGAGGRLYHLGRAPGFEEQDLDFEVLTYDDRRDDWFWNVLPSPPFERCGMNVTTESFADAGTSSTIRISAWNETYAFDAARASWHKEGDWMMPFHGRAHYVADYGLWFGFTDRRESDLCAADLDDVDGRAVRRHVWANVDGYANDGNSLEFSYLSYLGSGRFCVTRFFRAMDEDKRRIMAAAVTAVEATRAAASATGEMRMVKRASVLYRSPEWRLPCWAY